MASDTRSSSEQGSNADGLCPLTLAFLAVSAAFSAAVQISGRTNWLLLPGLLFIFSFVRLLPESNSEYKASLTLLLSLMLVGYCTSHACTVGDRRVSPIVGVASGGVATVLILAGGTWIGARWVLALHEHEGVTTSEAWLHMISLMTGIHQPYQVIEDGQVTTTRGKGLVNTVGGPGVAVIRPENAAIFEWGGEVTKIKRAGIVRTKRFEKVAKVLDLRPRWDSQQLENVLTRDRVPLSISYGVGFQLGRESPRTGHGDLSGNEGKTNGNPSVHAEANQSSSESERSDESLETQMGHVYPVEREDLFTAAYRLSGPWNVLPGAVGGLLLRRAVAAYDYRELLEWGSDQVTALPPDAPLEQRLSANPIKTIEQHIRSKLEDAADDWGLRITGFSITGIDYPEEVRQEAVVRQVLSRLAIDEARADAVALQEVSAAKIEAWQKMLDQILETINQSDAGQYTSRMATQYVTTLRQIELVEHMIRRGELELPNSWPSADHG